MTGQDQPTVPAAQAFRKSVQERLRDARKLRRTQDAKSSHALAGAALQQLQWEINHEKRRHVDAKNAAGEGLLLLCLAEVHLEKGGCVCVDAAEEAVLDALDLLPATDTERRQALGLLAEIHLKKGAFKKARETLKEAAAIKVQDRLLEAKEYHTQGKCRAFEERKDALRDAADSLGKAADVYRENGEKLQLARELHALGDVFIRMDDIGTALGYLEEAHELLQRCDEPSALHSQVLSLLVWAHLDNSSPDVAIRLASNAARDSRQRGDLVGEVLALQEQARATLEKGNAVQALHLALDVVERLKGGDAEQEAGALVLVSQVHRRTGSTADARQTAEDAVSLLRNLPDQTSMAGFLLHQAQLEMADGSADKAVGSACWALEVFREAAPALGAYSTYGIGRALVVLVEGYSLIGRDDSAIHCAEEAVERFESLGCCRLEADMLGVLADLRAKAGDRKQAMDLVRQRRKVLSTAGYQRLEAYAWLQVASIQEDVSESEREHAAKQGYALARNTTDQRLQVSLLLHLIDVEITTRLMKQMPIGGFTSNQDQRMNTAWSYANVAMELCGALSAEQLLGQVHFAFARLHALAGSLQLSEEQAKQANSKLEEVYDTQGQAVVILFLADLLRLHGFLGRAMPYAREAAQLFRELGDTGNKARADSIIEECGGLGAVGQAALPLPSVESGAASQAVEESAVKKLPALSFAQIVTKAHDVIQPLAVSDTDIDQDTSFMDAGLDSLAAVTLRSELEAMFSIRMSTTVVFDYPNLGSLAQYIHETVSTSA